MRVVVAPDSYKGSVSALEVANAMERGIKRIFPDAEVCAVPIADGGEGTVAALVPSTQGRLFKSMVSGPLGRRRNAEWGVLGDGRTVIIEMAEASGLMLVPASRRDPRLTSTRGTGELIREALDAGFRRIVIGIGGSATNDGGAGMARALGVRFLDSAGKDLPEGGAALANLHQVDLSGLDTRLLESEIIVACDVDNPLCGPRGASAVFGPQKGATPEMIVELDAALAHYAKCVSKATGRDVADRPGAGAAGGLGAGLMFFTPAELKPGVSMVLDVVGFADLVSKAAFVITGEGRTDFQTAFGKAPVGVAKVAKRFDVPVFCLSGSLGAGADDVIAQGIDAVMSIVDKPMALRACMGAGADLIEAATTRLCRIIKAAWLIDIAD